MFPLKLFQNRFVAVIIAAAVIVFSTIFAGRSNLSRACRQQEEAFFTVTEGKAPVYYVDQIISASASLADLAEKSGASADAAADLRTARRALVNAEEKRDLSDMYAAYRSVLTAADSVELTFDDPADRDLYDNCKSVISGASRELGIAVRSLAEAPDAIRAFIECAQSTVPEL